MDKNIPIAFKVVRKTKPLKVTEEQKEKWFKDEPVPPSEIWIRAKVNGHKYLAQLINEIGKAYTMDEGYVDDPQSVFWLYKNNRCIQTYRGMSPMNLDDFSHMAAELIREVGEYNS